MRTLAVFLSLLLACAMSANLAPRRRGRLFRQERRRPAGGAVRQLNGSYNGDASIRSIRFWPRLCRQRDFLLLSSNDRSPARSPRQLRPDLGLRSLDRSRNIPLTTRPSPAGTRTTQQARHRRRALHREYWNGARRARARDCHRTTSTTSAARRRPRAGDRPRLVCHARYHTITAGIGFNPFCCNFSVTTIPVNTHIGDDHANIMGSTLWADSSPDRPARLQPTGGRCRDRVELGKHVHAVISTTIFRAEQAG